MTWSRWSISAPIVAAGALLALSILASNINFSAPSNLQAATPSWAGRTQSCRSEILQSVKPEKLTTAAWSELSIACYEQVRGEAVLADFDIRRSNLIGMQSDSRIVLWMVVAITVSGVGLAGLQLFAAYRLAGAGRGEFAASQELSIEQNRISVKSSVTGLLILIVSFAFFMVYVFNVYGAKELKQDLPEARAVRPIPTLGTGGYGPPPAAAPQSDAGTP
jgi:hypothetical protein